MNELGPELLDWCTQQPGRIAKLAALLQVPASLVSQWAHKRRGVPVARCAAIEVATGGEVRRWRLRPDDWWQHWPELVGVAGAPAVAEPLPVLERVDEGRRAERDEQTCEPSAATLGVPALARAAA